MLLDSALALLSFALFANASATLWWMLHAWRTPETLAATSFHAPDGETGLSFSLLVPARHEDAVLAHTLERLLESGYDAYEIIVVVGHDDPATTAVARQVEAVSNRVTVVVDTHAVKNKPKALNTGLAYCRGDVVGVFDAEDQVHPALLAHVDHAFRSTAADVVQGGVQLINFHSNWYALRNCLEYFFWFRSRLHLQARHGFIPLGGNTVFVRTDRLREVDGWDENCLAEDCDLGARLSTRGAKVVVAYDSTLVTREETPGSLYALFKQRTRWNQGFMQVYRKRDWRRLPTASQRALARYTLASPFLQAFSGVATAVGLVIAVAVRAPVGVALLTFLPIIPALATVAFEIVGLQDFGKQYGLRIKWSHYVKLVVGTPLYMAMLTAAATRAVWREYTGRNDWELTQHVGAHLEPASKVRATA
ncbi:glycosyltransferase [Nocardia sp. NPDC005825]|uniref:glycosyltransferase n=1 Tax=unclassified Nocardia TaxID=2637762 RepID=UPI0033E05321